MVGVKYRKFIDRVRVIQITYNKLDTSSLR